MTRRHLPEAQRQDMPTSEVFGPLSKEPTLNMWTGRSSLGSASVTVSLVAADDQDLSAVLPSAEQQWSLVSTRDGATRDAVARELLVLFNEDWNTDESGNLRPPVSAEEFKGRLTPRSVEFTSWGEVTIFYDDGDLFAGHSILAGLGERGECDHVELFG